MNNDLWSDGTYHELDKKRNQIANEVGGSKPDKLFQKLSVNKIRKTVKIVTKTMDKAFVKMTRKTTDGYACEAIGSRMKNDPRSDHITSKSTARSSQAFQDPDIITGSFKHQQDTLNKLCPDRNYSVIASPAFEKKKGEMQMKKLDKLKTRFCSNKKLLENFRLICREKHIWSRIASLVAPETLGAACDGDQPIQQMKVSPDMAPDHKNSCIQLNENVILRTVTLDVVFTSLTRRSMSEDLRTALFHGVVHLLGKLPEIPGERVLRVLRGLWNLK